MSTAVVGVVTILSVLFFTGVGIWLSEDGFYGGFVGFACGILCAAILLVMIDEYDNSTCGCENVCCNHKACCEEGHKRCLEKKQTKKETQKTTEDASDEVVIIDDEYKFYLEGEEVNGGKMDLDRYYKKVNEEEKEIYLTPKN